MDRDFKNQSKGKGQVAVPTRGKEILEDRINAKIQALSAALARLKFPLGKLAKKPRSRPPGS